MVASTKQVKVTKPLITFSATASSFWSMAANALGHTAYQSLLAAPMLCTHRERESPVRESLQTAKIFRRPAAKIAFKVPSVAQNRSERPLACFGPFSAFGRSSGPLMRFMPLPGGFGGSLSANKKAPLRWLAWRGWCGSGCGAVLGGVHPCLTRKWTGR
jgi:hypothetical protein